jgi:hypothetical protein
MRIGNFLGQKALESGKMAAPNETQSKIKHFTGFSLGIP